jgi:tetratricopeptide (TPR) repeat protein
MEVAHHYTEYIKQARQAETDGEPERAAELYEKAIKQKPLLEQPYNRLMIIYRKAKEYSKELKVINKAIDVFTQHYDEKKAPFKGSGKIAQLSKAILKSINTGKKAVENNYPEPIPKWMTRKKTVEKKMK